MNKNLVFRILLLFLLIALGVFLFVHFDLVQFFKDKNKIITFIKSYPYDEVVFILLQIVQVIAAPIPGELSGFIGGYLYGPFWGTLYSTIGLTIGSWLAFILAHFFGEPLLEKVVKKEVFEKFDHFMEHRGLFVSFLLFLIPGFPKDYLCYIMGMSRIPVLTFIVISTVGRFFGTAMLSISGNIAAREQYALLAVVALAAVVVSLLAWKYHDKILEVLKSQKK
ncbi:MAG: TVP38/TMEM64 family protein [Smithellaceae bacterium]|nr:TVP38/TMEM64 family protein [Syntrophaceae bacterium]MDD4240716.1 TVP38/TMEM64 family protein [Smithellaceae bacterium]NLX52777.1 TVP38/TMEM64 family protein [Deltaproteobacteria bacterium]